VVSFKSQSFYPLEKEPPISIGQEAGWAPEPIWMLWSREKSPALEELNPSHSAHKPEKTTRHFFPIFTKYFKILLTFNPFNHLTATIYF
jgi:hypothetical protein